MVDREFVKIENKVMPVDEIKGVDFEFNRNSQYGFANLLFIVGGIVTAFMWGILLFLGR